MARKQSEKPKMAAAAEVKTKPIRLDLAEDDHQTLRVVAAKHGKSMAAFVRDMVQDVIEKERRTAR